MALIIELHDTQGLKLAIVLHIIFYYSMRYCFILFFIWNDQITKHKVLCYNLLIFTITTIAFLFFTFYFIYPAFDVQAVQVVCGVNLVVTKMVT